MIFKQILNLLKTKTRMIPKYYNFPHNNINLLIINIFDTSSRILFFFFQKNKIKKKVLQIFQKEKIYIL